jgi:hypothetical protein
VSEWKRDGSIYTVKQMFLTVLTNVVGNLIDTTGTAVRLAAFLSLALCRLGNRVPFGTERVSQSSLLFLGP